MSEDLERLLRDVPGRVPSPDPEVTRRVRDRLLGFNVRRRRRVSMSVLAAVLVGIAIGYWAIPQEEAAIGAADPPQVSISATPNVLKLYNPLAISGRIVARKANEYVAVEENVCGRGWMPSTGGQTNATGEYEVTLFGTGSPAGNVMLRARWGQHLSNVVRVSVRPNVFLRQKARRIFEAEVSSFRALVGRTAHLERYDKSSNTWRVAARAKLRPTSYGNDTEVRWRVQLPKGTIVRGVLPNSQARPCNLAGFSNMMTVAG
jgi:hypothetical protein